MGLRPSVEPQHSSASLLWAVAGARWERERETETETETERAWEEMGFQIRISKMFRV